MEWHEDKMVKMNNPKIDQEEKLINYLQPKHLRNDPLRGVQTNKSCSSHVYNTYTYTCAEVHVHCTNTWSNNK